MKREEFEHRIIAMKGHAVCDLHVLGITPKHTQDDIPMTQLSVIDLTILNSFVNNSVKCLCGEEKQV